MPTSTLWRKGDALPRHGHPSAGEQDPNKYQWHFASQVHRTDPDAHVIHESWTTPNWSRNGDHWTLSDAERTMMLFEARRRHDAAAQNLDIGSLSVPITPQASDALKQIKAEAARIASHAPAPADTSDPAPTFPAPPAGQAAPPLTLAEVAERLDNAEELTLLAAEKAEQAQQAAKQLRTNVERDLSQHEQEIVHKLRRQDEHVKAILADMDAKLSQVRRVEVVINDATHELPAIRHFRLEALITLASALTNEDRNIWITGPAGSGKTTAARQLAETLSLPFEFVGAIDTPYKLSGYQDANGHYHSTPFRRMYEQGGVILLDECDGSSPGALLEINAALANSHASFPDGMVKRHPNCVVLAAANTWGHGGDANYVGRAKLDAAFLDRFVTLSWPYDEQLEAAAAGTSVNPLTIGNPATDVTLPAGSSLNMDILVHSWVACVQGVRHEAASNGAMIVVSPRASIKGAQLLRARVSPATVVEAIFGRYRTSVPTWSTIGRAAEEFAKISAPAPVKPTYQPRMNNDLKAALQNIDFSGVKSKVTA